MESQNDKGRAEKVGVSLFPVHVAIVEQFAEETHRNFSNATQFIIEDWARQKRLDIRAAAPRTEPV